MKNADGLGPVLLLQTQARGTDPGVGCSPPHCASAQHEPEGHASARPAGVTGFREPSLLEKTSHGGTGSKEKADSFVGRALARLREEPLFSIAAPVCSRGPGSQLPGCSSPVRLRGRPRRGLQLAEGFAPRGGAGFPPHCASAQHEPEGHASACPAGVTGFREPSLLEKTSHGGTGSTEKADSFVGRALARLREEPLFSIAAPVCSRRLHKKFKSKAVYSFPLVLFFSSSLSRIFKNSSGQISCGRRLLSLL